MKISHATLILLSWWVVAPAAAAANIATLGTASQSSTFTWQAFRAIDGNRNGNLPTFQSVTHTQFEANAWWQVALPALSPVDQILIFNRTDCCAERLSPFNLYILNGATITQSFLSQNFSADITGPDIQGMTFDTSAVGNIVRVELVGTNFLSLAEVEIYPLAAAIPEPSTYALMLVGFGAVVVVARRRTRKPAAAPA